MKDLKNATQQPDVTIVGQSQKAPSPQPVAQECMVSPCEPIATSLSQWVNRRVQANLAPMNTLRQRIANQLQSQETK